MDVCIVGAGISGLTTAYLLSREGKKVAVLEDGQIGAGETGRTTAHIVNALDDRYYELERLHGEKGLQLAAASHTAAINKVEEIVQAEKINVWSTSNPKGDKILMMMLEDPAAVAQAAQFADLKGYSLLACGIGSLRGALKGDAAGAEAGVQKVLTETKRTKLVNMLTATTQDVEQRVHEGFLGILAQGQNPDEAIKLGRAAAKR